MPIATPEVYAEMLDRAKERGFAYPAINVTSSQTLNAALRGFADAGSDGIVQISTGGERETPLLGSVEHLRVNLWGRDWHDDDSLGVGLPPL